MQLLRNTHSLQHTSCSTHHVAHNAHSTHSACCPSLLPPSPLPYMSRLLMSKAREATWATWSVFLVPSTMEVWVRVRVRVRSSSSVRWRSGLGLGLGLPRPKYDGGLYVPPHYGSLNISAKNHIIYTTKYFINMISTI